MPTFKIGGLYRRKDTPAYVYGGTERLPIRVEPDDTAVFLKLVSEHGARDGARQKWHILTDNGLVAEYEGYTELMAGCWEKLC